MIKKLKDCNVGDTVVMYCIGWGKFDNKLSKIISKNSFIEVKDESGTISHFTPEAECRTID